MFPILIMRNITAGILTTIISYTAKTSYNTSKKMYSLQILMTYRIIFDVIERLNYKLFLYLI